MKTILSRWAKWSLRITALSLLLMSCRFTGGDWEEVDPPDDFSFVYQGSAAPIDRTLHTALYDHYAFSSDGNGVIVIYNVITSIDPYLVSSLSLPTGNQPIRKIEVDWRYYLYVAAGNGGLFVVDSSNQNYPSIAFEDRNIRAFDLSLQDDYLAVIDHSGWKLFEVVGASHLSEMNYYIFFDGRQPQRILLRNNWVYVFSQNYLDIFDVTNPFNTRLEKSFTFGNSFVDFDIIGNFIALATTNDLYFIDISTPLLAETVQIWRLGILPVSIKAKDDYLFIVQSDRILSAWKIWSVTTLPTEESRISFPNVVRDIAFEADMMYLSMGNDGMHIYFYFK